MDRRQGTKESQAIDKVFAEHKMTLRDYLRREINRGVSDIALGRQFGVHRRTIALWLEKRDLIRVTRVFNRRSID